VTCVAPRFHRVEAIFGGPLGQVTYADLAELVGNPDAAEGEDLDFKAAHYSPEKKTELAKDFAALANTIGGVLVIGLADDRKSRVPTAAVPVELTDGRLRQIRQTLASNLRPTPRIELIPKQDSPGSNEGILLIAVGRSLPGLARSGHRRATVAPGGPGPTVSYSPSFLGIVVFPGRPGGFCGDRACRMGAGVDEDLFGLGDVVGPDSPAHCGMGCVG